MKTFCIAHISFPKGLFAAVYFFSLECFGCQARSHKAWESETIPLKRQILDAPSNPPPPTSLYLFFSFPPALFHYSLQWWRSLVVEGMLLQTSLPGVLPFLSSYALPSIHTSCSSLSLPHSYSFGPPYTRPQTFLLLCFHPSPPMYAFQGRS